MPSDEWDVFSEKTKTLVLARPRMNPADWGRLLANTMRAIDTAAERRGIERAAKMHHEIAELLLAESKNEQFNEPYRSRARISAHEHAQHALEILALAQPMADAGQTEPPAASTGRG